MTVLLLRLAAPLQSWGTSSRFVRRNTDRAPSRSGVIGLLAAAKGHRRTDSIEDLLQLRIGVRVEQPGHIERDFQTARPRDGGAPMPLSYRFYLSDAVFIAAVQGERALLEGLREALRRPVFPLFLGRRSCPPAGQLDQGLRDGDIAEVLAGEPWHAAKFVQDRHRADEVTLDTVIDCAPDTFGSELVRDDPISFDPSHRQYGWRTVRRGSVTVRLTGRRAAPLGRSLDPHDPWAALEGAP